VAGGVQQPAAALARAVMTAHLIHLIHTTM
jgi:hypothetical protein